MSGKVPELSEACWSVSAEDLPAAKSQPVCTDTEADPFARPEREEPAAGRMAHEPAGGMTKGAVARMAKDSAAGIAQEPAGAMTQEPTAARMAFAPESAALGVAAVLLLAGLQRLIGFVRAVWFCRHLTPEELGKWELLFSFLNLAAPLVIFSLPGTFGRYAERYRRQGQLRSFLRQTALVCAGLTGASVLAIGCTQPWLDLLLFGSPGNEPLLRILPWTLASIICLNYLTELFTALRSVRISSMLFFLSSVLFAGLGVGFLVFWRNDALSVTAAYGLSNLAAAAVAGLILRRHYRLLPPEGHPLDRGELWRRLIPFALSVWMINLATNLFSIADRYVIVHLAPGGPDAALELVGQYHSSRLLPLLVLSVIQMLAAMILPYMSAEWEAGRTERAGLQMRLALKLLAFGMTGLSALALVAAPLLFQTALAGKFQAGQQVLPGTLIYCIWFGLALAAQNYLWCAEKAYLATGGLIMGLASNVALNCWLLPKWGLHGVVLAAAISHLAALAVMLTLACRVGFQTDKALLPVLLLPASLILGPAWALSVVVGVGTLALLGRRLLSPEEKQLLQQGLLSGKRGLRWLVRPPAMPEDLP